MAWARNLAHAWRAAPGQHLGKVDDASRWSRRPRARNSVSFALRPGELYSIIGAIGATGAGKTTMLNRISGHYRPDTASVTFKDPDSTRIAPRRRTTWASGGVATTWPRPGPFNAMTVLDKLMVGRHRRHPALWPAQAGRARPSGGHSAPYLGPGRADGGDGRTVIDINREWETRRLRKGACRTRTGT